MPVDTVLVIPSRLSPLNSLIQVSALLKDINIFSTVELGICMESSPKSWSSYVDKMTSTGGKPQAKFSRFRARFIVAKNLESISIKDMSVGTSDAYFAALRVTLAFTALEALENAIGCKNQIKVSDITLARQIRMRHTKIISAIEVSLNKNGTYEMKNSMALFKENISDDVLPFVYGFRNLMAHGQFTPNHFGLTNAPLRIKLINDLSDATLDALDDRFTQYVRKL
jgi:hypothetical protein